MSSVQPPQGTGAVAAPAQIGRTNAGPAVERADALSKMEDEPTVSIDTLPSAPPAEVLDHVAEAGKAYDDLQTQGLEVHYSYDPQSRRTTAELRHVGGETIRSLTLSEAMELAAGEGAVKGPTQ